MDAQYIESDLGQLSNAERLWIWRRRQTSRYSKGDRSRQSTVPRAGRTLTRPEAAEVFGLTERIYAQLEVGDALLELDKREHIHQTIAAMPPPTIGELCAVARKRSGGGLVPIERVLGWSRPKIIEMERCGEATLVLYWKARGFKFPTGA